MILTVQGYDYKLYFILIFSDYIDSNATSEVWTFQMGEPTRVSETFDFIKTCTLPKANVILCYGIFKSQIRDITNHCEIKFTFYKWGMIENNYLIEENISSDKIFRRLDESLIQKYEWLIHG